MSKDFHLFSKAVAAQFKTMSKGELFTVAVDKDELYAFYQRSFPTGTNEIFRVAREHECSCCRQFIKGIGPVVRITETGLLTTVWDNMDSLPEPYASVARAMSQHIKAQAIASVFRSTEPRYGNAETKETIVEPGKLTVIKWNHFVGEVDAKHYAGKSAAEQIGKANAAYQVFKRGLTELTKTAFETVVDLLNQKVLYRGEEFAKGFSELYGMQGRFNQITDPAKKDAFIWANMDKPGARLRNTAFGTLLIDLSDGLDVDSAMKKYEVIMAPTNYKRPTALITPAMVTAAMKTVGDLGIEPSLARRMAVIEDVSVNDILFVDNEVRSKMKDGSVAGLLMDVAAKQTVHAEPANATDISIDDFIKTVLPKAKKMSLFVKNEHQSNFVTLTAPVNADAPPLFKWDNGFAWSYDGNITDSIKERVKAQGGAVTGALRISLAWFNFDDLDLHVREYAGNATSQRSGYEIYFGNRGRRSPMGGMLDVDMNAGAGSTRNAVENVVYDRLTDGTYHVVVNNYYKRETTDGGFTLEIECNGKTMHYSAKSSPASGKDNNALIITVKGGAITDIQTGAGIIGQAFSQEKWGVSTETYVPVDTLMLSPNYWGDKGTGNKHYIFTLQNCKNPVPTRGIYNEFLKPELDVHRKVFEVLGNKTMCDPTDNQLSGVGFSSTKGDTVNVIVDNRRTYNVKF